ncbi:MAG: 5'-nucleotidase C-terminal domain-containing protein [Fervidobacterium sp.]|uniref:5'-nucleotidase C-terminal domain-containing protein n=1 Tax=Fervidobacterium sp. TaxID=1871331 RepID=UPI00404B70CB
MMFKKWKILLVSLFILVSAFVAAQSNANVTIVHTSNIYGNVLPYNYFNDTFEPKGLTYIYSYVTSKRAENRNFVLIDTGNILYGSPFGDYFVEKDIAENRVLELINKTGYDVLIPGTFELSLGKEYLNQYVKQFNGFVLATNLVGEIDGIKNYYVKVLPNGIKIAIFGVVPPYGEYKYSDYIANLRERIDRVKKEVAPDAIVLATSGGISYDPVKGSKIALQSNLNIGDTLVKNFSKDVNVFLFGNQAFIYTGKNQNMVYSLPGNDGLSVNEINLEFTKDGTKWKLNNVSIKNVKMADIKVNEDIISWAQKFETEVEKWLSENLFASAVTIGFNKYMAILEDSLITELVNKSIIEYTKAQIGIWNVFNPNFKGIVEGNVTRKDLYGLVGKTTSVKVLRLSGREVKEIIKSSLQYLSFEDSKVLFSRTVVNNPWFYDLIEGINYKVVLNNGTIREIMFLGKPLEDSDTLIMSVPAVRTYGQYPLLKGKVIDDIEVPVQKILFSTIGNLLSDGVIANEEDKNRESLVLLTYIVQAGDTFRQVAYRLGVSEEELLKLNPIIKDPNLIRPGWKFIYYKKYLDLIPPLKELFEAK